MPRLAAFRRNAGGLAVVRPRALLRNAAKRVVCIIYHRVENNNLDPGLHGGNIKKRGGSSMAENLDNAHLVAPAADQQTQAMSWHDECCVSLSARDAAQVLEDIQNP